MAATTAWLFLAGSSYQQFSVAKGGERRFDIKIIRISKDIHIRMNTSMNITTNSNRENRNIFACTNTYLYTIHMYTYMYIYTCTHV